MVTSTSPLRFGGNAVWSEWFTGLIDEVRVHDRALTAAQIAADRDTPIATAGLLARRGARARSGDSRHAAARPADRRSLRQAARARRHAARARHRVRWLRPRA